LGGAPYYQVSFEKEKRALFFRSSFEKETFFSRALLFIQKRVLPMARCAGRIELMREGSATSWCVAVSCSVL